MSESSYILGQVIARGGMAEVFRGLHVGKDGFRRLVAIKRVLPQHASNGEFADMFRDEAYIGQRLQHANIVKVEGYEVIDGSPAIVMEFVDGADLRAILAEIEKSKSLKRMPVPMALFIIAEAARGLHYAHQRHDDISGRPLEIVHRDISPQNVLISFNGEVKVTDFGIASADRDFKNTETRAGIVKGKYSYMSPEQISAKKVNARSDIFALSIVLWEVLAMRRMFTADSEVDVIESVKNCRFPGRLSEFNSEVSEELEAIVLKGLAKDPAKRFGSMDEFERCIRAFINKAFPTFTVGDLANLMKLVMVNRHGASQEEIKKMLTSTNLKAAKSGLELELSDSDLKKTHPLNVSRRPSDAGQRDSSRGARTRTLAPINTLDRSSTGKKNSTTSRQNGKLSWVGPVWFAATILLAITGFLFKTQLNAAKDHLSVPLRANPSQVIVKINGKASQGGRYIRTPANVRLETGTNLVEIIRTGYTTETISVDTLRNEHRAVQVINLKPRSVFAPTRIVLTGNSTVQVLVNEGFASGTISPQQPVLEIKDLPEGLASNILILEKNQKPFRCRFTPLRASLKRPFIIMVDPDRGTCEVRSPRERGEP